jgi:hypothetical protein
MTRKFIYYIRRYLYGGDLTVTFCPIRLRHFIQWEAPFSDDTTCVILADVSDKTVASDMYRAGRLIAERLHDEFTDRENARCHALVDDGYDDVEYEPV